MRFLCYVILKRSISSIIGISSLLLSVPVLAASFAHNVVWTNGSYATTCYSNVPELAPLSVPRTLIVDNHLPNGTELFSWGYGDFIPNVSTTCADTVPVASVFNGGGRFFTRPFGSTYPNVDGVYSTSIPGIGIKLFTTYTGKGVSDFRPMSSNTSRLINSVGSWANPSDPINVEFMVKQATGIGVWMNSDSNWNTNPTTQQFSTRANHVSYSFRAVLVKTGNIVYTSTPLTLPKMSEFAAVDSGFLHPLPNMVGGGGITIVPPACQLKTPTSYTINIGRWVNSGPGSLAPGISLPAYGSIKPVDLNLECSGQVNGVQFRFEDAGSSPSSNKNISLYDSAGGNKIEGLEIEMRYGGSRVAVDNITKTDTGSKGAIKTNPQDLSFNSQDSATFGARFVQTAPIKKSGAIYTGPVTGKVNMYVTYH